MKPTKTLTLLATASLVAWPLATAAQNAAKPSVEVHLDVLERLAPQTTPKLVQSISHTAPIHLTENRKTIAQTPQNAPFQVKSKEAYSDAPIRHMTDGNTNVQLASPELLARHSNQNVDNPVFYKQRVERHPPIIMKSATLPTPIPPKNIASQARVIAQPIQPQTQPGVVLPPNQPPALPYKAGSQPLEPQQIAEKNSWWDDTTNFVGDLFETDEQPAQAVATEPMQLATQPPTIREAQPLPDLPPTPVTQQPALPMPAEVKAVPASPVDTIQPPPEPMQLAPLAAPQTVEMAPEETLQTAPSEQPTEQVNAARYDGYEMAQALADFGTGTNSEEALAETVGNVASNQPEESPSELTAENLEREAATLDANTAVNWDNQETVTPSRLTAENTPAPNSEDSGWFGGLRKDLENFFEDEEKAQEKTMAQVDIKTPDAPPSPVNEETFLAPPPANKSNTNVTEETTKTSETVATTATPDLPTLPKTQNTPSNTLPALPPSKQPSIPNFLKVDKEQPTAPATVKITKLAPEVSPEDAEPVIEKAEPNPAPVFEAEPVKKVEKKAPKPAPKTEPVKQAKAPEPKPEIKPELKKQEAVKLTPKPKVQEIKPQDIAPAAAPEVEVEPKPEPQAEMPAKQVALQRDEASKAIQKQVDSEESKPMEMASLPEAKPAPTTSTAQTSVLTFSAQDTALSETGKPTLNELASALKASDDKRLVIKAYAAAEEGEKVLARRIALARGLAVRSYLIDQGVSALRINVQSVGNNKGTDTPNEVVLELK